VVAAGPVRHHDQVASSVELAFSVKVAFREYDGKYYADGKPYVTAFTQAPGFPPATVDLAKRTVLTTTSS
jgi:hypothetical protein